MTTRINGVAFTRDMEMNLVARKSASREASAARRRVLASKHPDILAVEKEINDVAIEISTKMITMPSEAQKLQSLGNDMIAKLRSELSGKLQRYGLPPDYLDEQYICAECRDTGRVNGRICGCMLQLAVNAQFLGSGLNPLESFDTFNLSLFKDEKQKKAMSKIKEYCLAYADGFPNTEKRDILFMGAPGVGKTFLLNCIGGRTLGCGHSVLKLNSYKLIQMVMDSFRSEAGDRPDFLLPELLIIDDLGAEPMIGNVTVETILSILCERQDANKATLIATNCSSDDLASIYGTRVVSRLVAPRTVQIIEIDSQNLRLTK